MLVLVSCCTHYFLIRSGFVLVYHYVCALDRSCTIAVASYRLGYHPLDPSDEHIRRTLKKTHLEGLSSLPPCRSIPSLPRPISRQRHSNQPPGHSITLEFYRWPAAHLLDPLLVVSRYLILSGDFLFGRASSGLSLCWL